MRTDKLLSQPSEGHKFARPADSEQADLAFTFLQNLMGEVFARCFGRLELLYSIHRVANPPESGSLPSIQLHWALLSLAGTERRRDYTRLRKAAVGSTDVVVFELIKGRTAVFKATRQFAALNLVLAGVF